MIKWTIYFIKYTLEPPNSHTPNSHTYPNSHTFFGLTKMWLFGYAYSYFFGVIFSVYENIINYKSSFSHQEIIFRIKNKNRVFKLESIPLMRNLPGTQIVTKYPNSHIYPNSHRFLVSRKCDYLEALQYAFYDFIIHKLLLNLFNHNNSICIFMTESAIYCE